jgi:hypothetical protein
MTATETIQSKFSVNGPANKLIKRKIEASCQYQCKYYMTHWQILNRQLVSNYTFVDKKY